MTQPTKVSFQCSHAGGNCRHVVLFHANGTVISNHCGDVTERAKHLHTLLRLGRSPNDPSTCEALAALVLYGCEAILRRTPNEAGDQPLDGWYEIYARFEELKVVKTTMDRVRRKLRAEAKSGAAA